jgi:hypothetical protein
MARKPTRIARTIPPVVLAVGGLIATREASAQAGRGAVSDFLSHAVVLTAADSARLTHGDVVVRLPRTGNERDVAVVGAVQVDVPRSFFSERQRDFSRALRTPTRTQVQRFSQPAVAQDLQALALSDDDLKELSTCKPNDCNFKLPAADMEHVRAMIEQSAPDARERVTTYARDRMAEYVTDYRARGNAAMIVYDDRGTVHSSDAFDAMMRDSSYAFSAVPSLSEYLLGYPRRPPPGAVDVIFWSRDEMPKLRPVVRITHEVIYSPAELADVTLVAAKQIYANHYFEAGLEVLAAADRATPGSTSATAGITLVAVRRYRFDHLPSGGVMNIRSRAINGLRDNVVAELTRLKRESESAWTARGH